MRRHFSANLNISANFASHEGIFQQLGKREKAFRRQMKERTLELDMRYFNFEIPSEFRPHDAHHSVGQSTFRFPSCRSIQPFLTPNLLYLQFHGTLICSLMSSFQFIQSEDSHEERYTYNNGWFADVVVKLNRLKPGPDPNDHGHGPSRGYV